MSDPATDCPGNAVRFLPYLLRQDVYSLRFDKAVIRDHFIGVNPLRPHQIESCIRRVTETCEEANLVLNRKGYRLDCKVCICCAPNLVVTDAEIPRYQILPAPRFKRRRCE
jgi:hypothetical protein